MHRPPAVSWDVGPARWHALLVLALLALGLLLTIAFAVLQAEGARWPWLLVLLLACSSAALLQWRGMSAGQLRWDGERWLWSPLSDLPVTELHCVLDLQRFMLLRLRCGPAMPWGRGWVWLWLESDAGGARWLALRRAIAAQPAISAQADSNAA